MITRRSFIKEVAAGTVAMAGQAHGAAETRKRGPNIVLILGDDVGYGDLGCYGASQVRTPNLNRLAQEGVRFTDAHSTSSVCTPSRYGILTGQYGWRNTLGDHILSGVAPLSIAPGTATTPSVLKQAGYATGLVGKWHLGLGTEKVPVDYNREIAPGPLDVGFDYAFFYPATNDRVPCVYIENRRVAGLDASDPIQVSYDKKVGDDPTGKEHPELLKMKADASHSQTIVNGISRIGYMAGGKSARWVDEEMADTLTGKAVAFIEQNKDRPFFLYFASHDIHDARFRGTSGCGVRGDAIHELDGSVGAINSALERLALTDNTLVIFASDNGGAIKDTYDDGTNSEHARQPPNGALRGAKGSLYEGGHRTPLIARWPGQITPGATSDELIGLVDMMATFAAITGCTLDDHAAPDSFNVLPALLGKKHGVPVRDHLVLHTNGGGPLGLRSGRWMLITKDRENNQEPELYDLLEDLAETKNVAKQHPEQVKALGEMLNHIQNSGHSRPK
ncbi:MAG: arylsulfatase [Candidatus Hydrogenedentes bacterium]|nr:arylsulfatase [Candidatus Hydrogenedentota bacterium]